MSSFLVSCRPAVERGVARLGVFQVQLSGHEGEMNAGPRLQPPRTTHAPTQATYIAAMQARFQKRLEEQAAERQAVQIHLIRAWLRKRGIEWKGE